MDFANETVLVTGGTSGIGLALARRLQGLGNKVIVTGRDQAKLDQVRSDFPGMETIQSDAGDLESVKRLRDTVTKDYPTLNILINCAGVMRKIDLRRADLDDVHREVEINLNGTIWTDVAFIPHLRRQDKAAIVNISSGLAFLPLPISPVYCATKSAIHAFTLSLRAQLAGTSIKVFEIAPPGTDTPLFHGDFTPEDTGGMKPMPVETLVDHMIKALKADKLESAPGMASILRAAGRIAPSFMLKQLSKSVEAMKG